MTSFPITAYDRPGLALGNLLAGDLPAMGTALVAPEKLAPSKLQRGFMATLKSMAGDNPLLRGIMSVATDPLVIISLLLSSRFPIVAANKMFQYGKRYAGYAHSPGYLEGIFGRAERIFAGTNVPKLMLRATQHTDKFQKKWTGMLSKWTEEFREQMGRYPTYQENVQLGAKLAGLDKPFGMPGVQTPLIAGKIQLGSSLQRLHDHVAQEFFPKFYREVVKPLQASEAGRKGLERTLRRAGIAQVGAPMTRFGGGAGSQSGVGVEVARYFPHTLIRTPQMVREYAEAVSNIAQGDPKLMQQLTQAAAVTHVSGHIMPRFGVLTPALNELKAAGLKLSPQALAQFSKRLDKTATHLLKEAEDVLGKLLDKSATLQMRGKPPTAAVDMIRDFSDWLRGKGVVPGHYRTQIAEAYRLFEVGDKQGFLTKLREVVVAGGQQQKYSTIFTPVVQNYIYSFARPYVWSVEKLGKGFPGLSPTLTFGRATNTEVGRLTDLGKRMMKADYLPLMQGQITEHQAVGMMRWSDMKLKAVDWLSRKDGVAAAVPKGMKTKLLDMLTQEKGTFSYLNAQGKVAGYFYYSALGFNPGSAFQNLLQPIITTMPMVGVKPYWQGMSTTMRKLTGNKGYFSLRAKGVGAEEAVSRAFPEFARAGMGPAPLSQAILRDSLETMWTNAGNLPTSGFHMHTRPRLEQLKRAAMGMFSGSESFNRLASFYAGMAKGKIDGLTGAARTDFAASVVRATQFPAGMGQMPRILLKLPAPWRQFLYFPIRYAGFLAESTLYGGQERRNWGTIARSMAASAATYRMGKEVFGTDLSRSLMFGALPIPDYEKSPFYPMPFVPPIAGIAGSLGMAALKGSTEPLAGAMSLLVPGGVQLRRTMRTLHPRYAKYKERLPDGRIPVFAKNQALVGAYTPMQLFMRSVGIKPADVTAEQGLTSYLLKHRDDIRDLRRQYTEALVKGNAEEAQRLKELFKRLYPELGELTIKPTDLRASRDRRMLTRLQRLSKTMPTQYRDRFQQIVNTAMANYTVGEMPMGGEPPAAMGLGRAQPYLRTPGGDVGSAFSVFSSGSTPTFGPASVGIGL